MGGNVKNTIATNSGRKKKYTDVVDIIKAIDPDKRGNTQRELAANTGLSKLTICRFIQCGVLQSTSGEIKSYLTSPTESTKGGVDYSTTCSPKTSSSQLS